MKKQTKNISIFEGHQIRRHWDEKKELWYFSIVDIIKILTNSITPRKYWNKLSQRLKKEGNESVTKCHQLKMIASDGKYYLTDVADTETLLRIIQSIPSPNAEPFKLWLAKVGYERIQETTDPERSINRARTNWQRMGHSQKWIQQRMMGQEIRNKLTDYWKDNDVINTNLLGLIKITNLVMPNLLKQKDSAIINISSKSGVTAQSGQSIYTASKWGVWGFTEVLKEDLKDKEIRIAGVYQSGTNTEMFKKAGEIVPNDKFTNPTDLANIICYMLLLPEKIWIHDIFIEY